MKNDIPGVSIQDAIIEWTPWTLRGADEALAGRAQLIPFPARGRPKEHAYDSGGNCRSVQEMTRAQRRTFMLSTALGMILRDRLHPDEVHRVLWPIKEYREALPPDTKAPRGDARYGQVADSRACWL